MVTENITALLVASSQGCSQAQQQLYNAVYDELGVIAHSHRRRWLGNETLNTTALVHEAYLKLAGAKNNFENRTHFYATASRAVRQVLVNYAERNNAEKRRRHDTEVELDSIEDRNNDTLDEVLIIDQLIKRIEGESERRCKIMECRIFGGMSIAETADALDISTATVKREWRLLSAWLYREIAATTQSKSECRQLSIAQTSQA